MSNTFEVVLLVDESGSMEPSQAEVVSSINKFIEDQRTGEGVGNLRIVKFSERVTELRDGNTVAIATVHPREYRPAGMTALADSMVSEIDRLGKKLALLSEDQRPRTVVFATITDGGENASSLVNKSKIKELVKQQTDKYSWQFIFLASGLEAINQAKSYGMGDVVRAYSSNPGGYKIASASLSNAVSYSRGGGKVTDAPFATAANQ